MINKELTEEESGAPNSADSASNENGDTGINREFVVGPTLDAAKFVKTSNKVRIEQVISEYEKVVLKNRKDDVDNDVSPLANTSSSSALREQLHCRTALSKASVPFHPVVQQGINKTNISVKSTQFYVNSCYPGETPQLSSTWKLLSSIAEPKSKVDEDKEGEDRKSSEENKGLSSNEEVPDTIPYVLVPSMAIQEGILIADFLKL